MKLNESPDRTIGIGNKVVNFATKDARAFGGLWGKIAFCAHGIYHGKLVSLAKEAANNAKPKFFGSDVNAKKFYANLAAQGIVLEPGMTNKEISAMLARIEEAHPESSAAASRAFLMAPLCGRLWIDSKIVTFWNRQSQVAPSDIEKLMRIAKLRPQDFRYQFIGHEESKYEDLPDWDEINGKSHPSPDKIARRYATSEEEIQNLMKRAHTQQTTMTDVEREIVAANRGKGEIPDKPIWPKQLIQTSESKIQTASQRAMTTHMVRRQSVAGEPVAGFVSLVDAPGGKDVFNAHKPEKKEQLPNSEA